MREDEKRINEEGEALEVTERRRMGERREILTRKE